MQEHVPFLSAMGTLRSCKTLFRLLDLVIEHGLDKEILVSSKGPLFRGFA